MPAPGSNVTTGIALGLSRPDAPPSATTFVATALGFGPVGWRPYRALADLLADYGSGFVFNSNLGMLVASYFAEGGDLLYMNRMVGPDAAASSLALEDRNDPAGVALTITAATVGAWGDLIAITIEDGTGDTVDLTVDLDPTLAAPLSVGDSSYTLENLASPAAIAAAIAAHPVRSTRLPPSRGATGTGPDDLPALLAAEPLAGGDDDLLAAGAAVDGWTPPADLGPGVIIGPSLSDLAALEPADLYQLATNLIDRRRILFTSSNGGDTLEDAIDDLDAIRGNFAEGVGEALAGQDATRQAARIAELVSAVGAFWPWIGMNLNNSGANPVVPVVPVGAVAAARSRAITAVGPHRAPAGEAGIIARAVGVAIWPAGDPTGTITEELAAEADAAGLNVIRTIGGTVRVYGYKPLQLPPEFAGVAPYAPYFPLLTDRDVLNAVAAEADAIAERYVFRPIDPRGHVFAELRRDLLGLGERFAAAGSLYAQVDPLTRAQLDPGYAVDTGPEVNTTETIAAGQIRAVMRIRSTPSGPFVDITVTKTALGNPL